MQNIYLDNFHSDIANIRRYIRHIHLVNKIEVDHRELDILALRGFRDNLHELGRLKKLFEYKSIVISLYGVLEKHINSWIQAHLTAIKIVFKD